MTMTKRHFKRCKTCTDYKNQFYDCDLCKYAKERNGNEKKMYILQHATLDKKTK